MSLRIALSLAAAALAFGGTSTLSTTSAMADGYVSIDQRGWGNGSAGSQRGFRNRLTIYQDGSRNSALSRQYGNHNRVVIGQQGSRNSANTYQNGRGNIAGVAQFGRATPW